MSKKPKCDQCGKCCVAPVVLISKPADYRRWVEQGREDILKHATIPPPRSYGDFLTDTGKIENPEYCPFAGQTDTGKFYCTIHDTKPIVCRKFYCEWSYREGKKGIPFRTDQGWTDKAKKLGYDQPRKKKYSGNK